MSHGQHGQRCKFTSFSIQKVARPSGTTLQLAVNSRKFHRTADNTEGKSRKYIVSEKSPSLRPAPHTQSVTAVTQRLRAQTLTKSKL